MKKIIAILTAVLLFVTISIPVSAESQTIASYTITKGTNFCTGTFEGVKTGALPQSGTNAELSATKGWRSNEYDYQTVSIVNKGYQGGNCLQIAGNGTNPYGAAYYIFPTGNIKRGETYEVTFMYKVTDPLTKTNQLHCDVMDGGVGETHTNIAGLAPLPGEVMKDGWRKVSGTFVVESPGTFKAIRFFAEFNYSGKILGAEANILIDNVEIAKVTAKSAGSKAVNLSSANLVDGGDFEYRDVNELYDPSFDEKGWWTRDEEKMASMVIKDGNNKVLRMAGNMMLNYGSMFVNFQEKMTAGKTYRLIFDYKFIGTTQKDTAQAHVAFMCDQDLQIGNPGGWSNVNLVVNDLGVSQANGYKRVAVDFTPNAFQAEAIYGLRFFINLAQEPNTFGVMFDNVRVSAHASGDNDDEGEITDDPIDDPSFDGESNINDDGVDGDGQQGGNTVDSDVDNNNVGNQQNDQSPNGWLLPVLIAAGVVLIVGGGFALWFFVLRKKGSKNN